MNIEDLKRAKRKLENELRVVIEAELKTFEAETGMRPVSVEVEMPVMCETLYSMRVGSAFGRVRVDLGIHI